MTRFITLFILFLLPVLEIAGFIIVGGRIGVLATIGLVLLAGIVGVALLRSQGAGAVNRIRAAAGTGKVPGRELAHGAMIMVAGILLIIPGFLTDIVGLLLFVPPVRDFVYRLLGDNVMIVTSFGPLGGAGGRGHTIDLGEEEYSRQRRPDRQPPRIEVD
ncbi:MAG: FxsA family protein [Rhizobiaceae bacterium]